MPRWTRTTQLRGDSPWALCVESGRTEHEAGVMLPGDGASDPSRDASPKAKLRTCQQATETRWFSFLCRHESWSGRRARLASVVQWLQDRQTRRFLSRALVVFSCSRENAATIDVARGPCQPRFGPRGGRIRSFALPSSQSYSTTFSHLTSLYSILTDRDAKLAVREVRKVGPGTIGSLTDDFVEVLTAVRLASLMSLEQEDQPFRLENEIGERWMKAARWGRSMRVGGLAMKIFKWSVECETATEKNVQVICWEGPAVPEYVIAHGTSMESYETYRKAGRR